MATDSERMRLVIEARNTASAEIRQLQAELNRLGGAPMVKANNAIRKLHRQIKQLSGETKKASGAAKTGRPIWTRFTQGIAIGNIAAMAATKSLSLLNDGIREIGKTAMVAAQVSELGNVYKFVGQRAGYTKTELEGYRTALLDSNIAQKETNQGLLRALQAEISLADAVKFGRIAQDAAVVGLTESSEAFTRIIHSIAKLMPRQLKELGIIINLNTAYRQYAEQHGKVAAHLSDLEKKQAFVNAIFDKGEVVAGAYEEAMFNVSKRIRSLPRLYQDLQVAIGEKFNPVLEVSVAMAEELLLDLTRLADTEIDLDSDKAKEDIVNLREKARLFMATVVSMGETVYDVGNVIKKATELTMIDPIVALGKVGEAVYTALSDPFDDVAWYNAGNVLTSAKDVFVQDFSEMETALDKLLGDEASRKLLENAERVGNSVFKMRQQIGKEVPPIVKPELGDIPIPKPLLDIEEAVDTEDCWERTFDHMEVGAVESLDAIEWRMTALQQQVTSSVFAMGDAFVDGFMQGRIEVGQIFKGMAADFMKFFVRKALFAVMSKFIPGLGNMLGGMFDTPRYDKMAMQQGADFAKYFTAGAMQGMSGMGPSMAYAGGEQQRMGQSQAAPTYNIYVTGNVLSGEFVERDVAPLLQKLVTNGRTGLTLDPQNATGDIDVRFD